VLGSDVADLAGSIPLPHADRGFPDIFAPFTEKPTSDPIREMAPALPLFDEVHLLRNPEPSRYSPIVREVLCETGLERGDLLLWKRGSLKEITARRNCRKNQDEGRTKDK